MKCQCAFCGQGTPQATRTATPRARCCHHKRSTLSSTLNVGRSLRRKGAISTEQNAHKQKVAWLVLARTAAALLADSRPISVGKNKLHQPESPNTSDALSPNGCGAVIPFFVPAPLLRLRVGFLIHDFWAGPPDSSIFGVWAAPGAPKTIQNMGGIAPPYF